MTGYPVRFFEKSSNVAMLHLAVFLRMVVLCNICINAAQQPNFVFILMDDQDILLDSPSYMRHLQALIVDEGVTFNNAFVATPVCCPSRTETVTGRYFHNIGAPNGDCMSIDATDNVFSNTTIFNQLYQNGYNTGVFGKLTNEDSHYFCNNPKNVKDAGMTRVYSMCSASDYYCTKYLDHYGNGTSFYTNLDKDNETTYQSAQIGNQSLAFIASNLQNNTPFLNYIGYHCPHEPYTPPPWFANSVPKTVKAPRTPNFNVQVQSQMEWVMNQPKLENGSIDYIDQIYRDRIECSLQVDVYINELMQLLEQYDAVDDTYIIYTSDHGYKLGQWRLPCEKSFIYDTDIRVPFYVRGPGINKGSKSDIVIGNVDIMPSVLDLAGVTIPDNVDGKSWASTVINVTDHANAKANEWREMFLSEYIAHAHQYFNICGTWFEDSNDFHGGVKRPNPVDPATGDYIWVDYGRNENALGSNTWREIRIINATHNWSYSEYINSSFTEDDKNNPYLRILFDVNKDPYQVNNIYDSTSTKVQQDLHQMLMTYGNCSASTCP
eukprot:131017_1